MNTVSQESGNPSPAAGRRTPALDTPHVVAVLPRGEAIRNFIYSGALDEVAAHAKVTVLSVVPDDDFQKLIASSRWSSIELDFLENNEWFYYFPRGFRWLGYVTRAVMRHPKYYSYLFVRMRK